MHTTDAILLRKIDYGESDAIVTLLTPDLGKVSAFAAGARKSRKRFASTLSGSWLMRVMLKERKGAQLYRLSEAWIDEPQTLRFQNVQAMAAAAALLEMVREGSAPSHPDSHLFTEVRHALLLLIASEKSQLPSLLLAAAVRTLARLGFAPRLDRCLSCSKPPAPTQRSLFSPHHGAIRCRDCGGGTLSLTAEGRSHLSYYLHLSSLQGMHEQTVANRLWREMKDLIESMLEYRLEKQIQGLGWFSRLMFPCDHTIAHTP